MVIRAMRMWVKFGNSNCSFFHKNKEQWNNRRELFTYEKHETAEKKTVIKFQCATETEALHDNDDDGDIAFLA